MRGRADGVTRRAADAPRLTHEANPPDDFLDRVACWPSVCIERRGDRATLRSRYPGSVLATVNRRTAVFAVHIPSSLAIELADTAMAPHVGADSARLVIADASSRRAAESLLRWRLDLERFAWQALEASP